MLTDLLLGTRNPARIALVRQILDGAPVRVVTLDEMGIRAEVDEDGRSTAENAEKKARAYFALTGLATLALDGGLRIARFAEERQPGVQVRRREGLDPGAGAAALLEHYRQALEEAGGESDGLWTASNALALSQEQVVVESFTFAVRFTTQARGIPEPGHALDPLMIDPVSGKYYTELRVEERPYYAPVAQFVRRWVLG